MPSVEEMAGLAAVNGYPALGLTDHGVMTGVPRFYKAARAVGVEPMPGVELYVARDRSERVAGHNLHLTVNATTETGYRNLVRLITMAHRNFFFKPIVDLADLTDLAEHGYTEGLICATGCHFGLVPTTLRTAGERHAARVVKILDRIFDAAYIELINHGVVQEDGWTDDMAVEALTRISYETGVPYVITADSHYLRPDEQPLHDAFKTLMAFGEDPDDATFPGGAYCFQDAETLKAYFEPKVIEVALDTLAEIADRAWCRIPELENQIKRVPRVSVDRDPQEVLEDLVASALSWRRVRRHGGREVIADTVPAYVERAREELDVVAATGTADYFLLAEWLAGEMTNRDIWFRARGSANNSLFCWALGITSVDPIEHDLLFGRFLTADRAKMPDIDLDVEHTRREEAVALLDSRFATMRVGTLMKYSLAGEAEDSVDAQKGSLRSRYMSLKRKRGVRLEHFADAMRNLPEEVAALHELSSYRLISGYGRHPSGFIVAPSSVDLELLPLYRMPKSGTLICAYDQGDVEDLGYMKLDLLGSKTLTSDHTTCTLVSPADPLGYFEAIPENDEKTYRRIRDVKVTGVFQLDGAAMRRGLRSLKPRKFNDLVVANALFRPAVTESGGDVTYIVRRDGIAHAPRRHPDIESVVSETMGVMLYQEQTLNLMRIIGMPPAEWNRLLKAVKASNEYVAGAKLAIEAAIPRIAELAAVRGWSDADVAFVAESVAGYANYCVAGDTVLQRSAGGRHSETSMTVAELCQTWHGPYSVTRSKYRTRGLRVLARDAADGRIRPENVLDVLHQGVRPTWTVTTESGHRITATANHKHATQHGWKRVDELVVGEDLLAIMGEREHYANLQNTGNPVGVHNGLHLLREEIQAIGACEWCGRSEGRLEIAHLDNDRTNNVRANLVLLCNSCHKRQDYASGSRKVRYSRGRPVYYSPVVSVVYAGEQDVYDLSMAGEDHSWVGNGIVTSNSFNKAHAVAYSQISVREAYLAEHHGPSYWVGKLNAHLDDDETLDRFIAAARREAIVFLEPHVNASSVGFTLEDGCYVRAGLNAITGIGPVAALELAAKAPYTDLFDLASRVRFSAVKGAKDIAAGKARTPEEAGAQIKILADAGALSGLTEEK